MLAKKGMDAGVYGGRGRHVDLALDGLLMAASEALLNRVACLGIALHRIGYPLIPTISSSVDENGSRARVSDVRASHGYSGKGPVRARAPAVRADGPHHITWVTNWLTSFLAGQFASWVIPLSTVLLAIVTCLWWPGVVVAHGIAAAAASVVSSSLLCGSPKSDRRPSRLIWGSRARQDDSCWPRSPSAPVAGADLRRTSHGRA